MGGPFSLFFNGYQGSFLRVKYWWGRGGGWGVDNHPLSCSETVLPVPLYAFMALMGKTLSVQIFICFTF